MSLKLIPRQKCLMCDQPLRRISEAIRPPTDGNILHVGDYTVRYMPDRDALWFEHKSGEGMQVNPETMQKIFKEFL